MSIRLKFLTAAIKKSAVRRHYPGGLSGFRQDFPDAQEDPYLIGICSMSGGELEEILARIDENGLCLNGCSVIGDQLIGPLRQHPHFAFTERPSQPVSEWQVRLIDEDPEVLAEDGARILRHFIRVGWAFDLGDLSP